MTAGRTVDAQRWYRMAGARVYHAARPDWIQSGKATCGADISRPGYAYEPTGAMPTRHYTRLSEYPKRFGMVGACKRCATSPDRGRA